MKITLRHSHRVLCVTSIALIAFAIAVGCELSTLPISATSPTPTLFLLPTTPPASVTDTGNLFFSQSGPAETAEKYLRAISNGEIEEALGYFSPAVVETYGGEDIMRLILSKMSQQCIEEGGFNFLDITEESITGDVATVIVQIEDEVITVSLLKENGIWKVTNSENPE